MKNIKQLGVRMTEIPQFVPFGVAPEMVDNEPINTLDCNPNTNLVVVLAQQSAKKDTE
jgi:hypothetical protein